MAYSGAVLNSRRPEQSAGYRIGLISSLAAFIGILAGFIAYALYDLICLLYTSDSRGFAPSWTICDPAAGQLCKARKAVGYALDHAKRKRRSAQACEKCRQDSGSSFVPPVREQTSEADAQDATREPAFCWCG